MIYGNVETPKYLPSDNNEYVRKRTFLRVPLTSASTRGASTPAPGGFAVWRGSATLWIVQVIHINVGSKQGHSYLGSKPLNKKIRLCVGAQNLGREAAAAASTRGAERVVTVSLGDFNLTETEVKDNPSAGPWSNTPSAWWRMRASGTSRAGFTRTSCWWTPTRSLTSS